MEEKAIFQEWNFHHIGYATRRIEDGMKYFSVLGYSVESDPFEDQTQGIKGVFITGGGPRVELLENLQGRNTLDPWLSAGIAMYHFAYEVPNIFLVTASLKEMGAKVITPPVEATAFNGRKISFVMMRNAMLVEMIEK